MLELMLMSKCELALKDLKALNSTPALTVLFFSIIERSILKKLARNVPETTPVVGDDDYKRLKRKLNNHFLPKKNEHHARFTFNKQKQIAGESVVTYAVRLREKLKDCEFGEQTA